MAEQERNDGSRMRFAHPEKVARDYNYWAKMMGSQSTAVVEGVDSIRMHGPIDEVRKLFAMTMNHPTGLDAEEKREGQYVFAGMDFAAPPEHWHNVVMTMPINFTKEQVEDLFLNGRHWGKAITMDDIQDNQMSDPARLAAIIRHAADNHAERTAMTPKPAIKVDPVKRDTGAYLGVMKVKTDKETLMKIVSIYGFEPHVPKGYISDKHPWVKAHYGEKVSAPGGLDVYLELGETIDEVGQVSLGDVYTGETFSKIYKYLMRAGDRYGRLKRHDKSCHHSIERFEV